MRDSDIPLRWNGDVVAAVRMPDLYGALRRSIAAVEKELGGPVAALTRVDKQQAVRMLYERGVFTVRRSIEDVADAMGVSRITIYNYLNAISDHDDGYPPRQERPSTGKAAAFGVAPSVEDHH
jgi:transposase-like protein